MNRLSSLLAAVLLYAAAALAQSGGGRSALVEQMNGIKNQSDRYYWNQYTHKDADSARIGATRWLLDEINSTLPPDSPLSLSQLMPHVRQVKIDRGNVKQIFVYITKTEAAALGGGQAYTQQEPTTGGQTYTPQPQEPTNGGQTYTPQPSRPYDSQGYVPVQPRSFVADAFVQQLMQTKYFRDVYRLLQSLKTQGVVQQFGKLSDVGDYSSLNLILFDKQTKQIVTVLSGIDASGSRTNLAVGMSDDLSNYPSAMTAVIWYIKN